MELHYSAGKFIRLDQGVTYHYLHNQLHREDGPAIVGWKGNQYKAEFWYRGIKYWTYEVVEGLPPVVTEHKTACQKHPYSRSCIFAHLTAQGKRIYFL